MVVKGFGYVNIVFCVVVCNGFVGYGYIFIVVGCMVGRWWLKVV